MYALNNVATANAYTTSGGSRLPCRGAVKYGIQVHNAAVLMETTIRSIDGATSVGADEFLAPGFYSHQRPVDLLRFKSAVTDVHAAVTVTALTQAEV